jgi:hypothetical protein
MSDYRQHLIKYPSARTSTVIYLRKRDETTERLRQEIGMQEARPAAKPWWQRLLSAFKGETA